MTFAAKAFITLILTAGLGFGSLVGGVTYYCTSAGSIVVKVDSADGDRFNLRVPAVIAELPLAFVPSSVVEEALAEAGPEARRELHRVLPAIQEAADRLIDSPDFELVRVRDGETTVVVEKVRGAVHVTVDGPDKIEVRVPVRLVKRVTRILEAA